MMARTVWGRERLTWAGSPLARASGTVSLEPAATSPPTAVCRAARRESAGSGRPAGGGFSLAATTGATATGASMVLGAGAGATTGAIGLAAATLGAGAGAGLATATGLAAKAGLAAGAAATRTGAAWLAGADAECEWAVTRARGA